MRTNYAVQLGDLIVSHTKKDAPNKKLPARLGPWSLVSLAELMRIPRVIMYDHIRRANRDLLLCGGRIWWCDSMGPNARWWLLTPREWARMRNRTLTENFNRDIVVYDTQLASCELHGSPQVAANIALSRAHLKALIGFASQQMPEVVFPGPNGSEEEVA